MKKEEEAGRARHCFYYLLLTKLLEGLRHAVVAIEHEVDHTLVLVEAAKS